MTKKPQEFCKAIKLIHSSELGEMRRFTKYQDYDGITYRDYQVGSERVSNIRHYVLEYIEARDRLDAIDHDGMVVYDTILLEVPRSWLRLKRRIELTREKLSKTHIECDSGTIDGDFLIVQAGWRKKTERVVYSCPSNVVNRNEIDALKETLSNINEQDKRFLAEFLESPYTHPVLFVSHRWESVEHPDPNGRQLEKLKKLKDCYIIYDYSSFPQKPRSAKEDIQLDLILRHMDEVIANVVVLDSPEYTERGWCIYEYIVSALKGSIVCDEVQEEDFVELRDWVSTGTPIPVNFFRDSFESMQQNYINEQILHLINRILPTYAKAKFTEDSDQAIVRSLLIKHLKSVLPAKKKHQPYIGEWKTVPWEDAELEAAFSTKLEWPSQQTMEITSHKMNVPKCIEDAVTRRYEIRRETLEEKFKMWRGWGGGATRRESESENKDDIEGASGRSDIPKVVENAKSQLATDTFYQATATESSPTLPVESLTDDSTAPTGEDIRSICSAAEVGDTDEVRHLLEQNPRLLSSTNSDGKSALHMAAALPYTEGHFEVAKLLIAKGADVNARDNEGSTTLHWVACRPQLFGLQIAELLLEHGANPDAESKGGDSPKDIALRWSSIYGHQMLELMERGSALQSSLATPESPVPSEVAEWLSILDSTHVVTALFDDDGDCDRDAKFADQMRQASLLQNRKALLLRVIDRYRESAVEYLIVNLRLASVDSSEYESILAELLGRNEIEFTSDEDAIQERWRNWWCEHQHDTQYCTFAWRPHSPRLSRAADALFAETISQIPEEADDLVRLALARNPNVSTEVMVALTRAPEPYTRICLAASRRTPANVLSRLATDGNSYVRRWVASNPNADVMTLDRLSRDQSKNVRDFLKRNPRFK
jgi:hypothetical protein